MPSLNFQHCRQLATLVASYNGKSITADKPVLFAALPKGERVQVIIPPACEPNTVSITIRKPSMIDKTLTSWMPKVRLRNSWMWMMNYCLLSMSF